MPLTIALIGAGTGLLKSELIDAPKEKRERELAAETQRYSPWTGMQAGAIHRADPFGSALQYGVAGAGMGQNIASADAMNAMAAQPGAMAPAMAPPPGPSMGAQPYSPWFQQQNQWAQNQQNQLAGLR